MIITNDTKHRVGYFITGILPRTLAPGASLDIPEAEAFAVASDQGGRVLLEEKALILQTAEDYETLGIFPTEYELSYVEARELLQSGDVVELDNIISYCSETTLDKIIEITVAEISDYNIISLVANRTKKDINGAKEERAATEAAAAAPTRR